MKFLTVTSATLLFASALLINAGPVVRPSTQVSRRASSDPGTNDLYARLLAERHITATEHGLYNRGLFSKIGSKISNVKNKILGPKKDTKAKYDVGNNRPETPVGEFRPMTAGKHDDYFGDWQTMTNGVHNPAAGRGRGRGRRDLEWSDALEERDLEWNDALEERGIFSKIGSKLSGVKSKIFGPKKDTKAKYDVGNNRLETPVGEFRPMTAGKHDDYFGDWQTMTHGVNNPAAGRRPRSQRCTYVIEAFPPDKREAA